MGDWVTQREFCIYSAIVTILSSFYPVHILTSHFSQWIWRFFLCFGHVMRNLFINTHAEYHSHTQSIYLYWRQLSSEAMRVDHIGWRPLWWPSSVYPVWYCCFGDRHVHVMVWSTAMLLLAKDGFNHFEFNHIFHPQVVASYLFTYEPWRIICVVFMNSYLQLNRRAANVWGICHRVLKLWVIRSTHILSIENILGFHHGFRCGACALNVITN